MTQQMDALTPKIAVDRAEASPPIAAIGEVVRGARLFLAVADGEVPWFYRRAESIDFSQDAIKRTTRLDVELPRPAPFLLPLAFRYKSAPGPVLVLDQAGYRVPILTTEECAEIVFTALVLAADEEGVPPSAEEEDLLLSVVTSGRRVAEVARAELLRLQPAWEEGRLRQLIELVQLGLPVFAVLQGEERRMVLNLEFPPQDLYRPVHSRWLAAVGSFLRGGITVGGEISNWPAVSSNHAQFEAPPVGEIASLRVGNTDSSNGFMEIGQPGSSAALWLYESTPGKNPVIWLRMVLRRSLAVIFAIAALALVLIVALLASGSLGASTNRVGTAVVLLIPVPVALRIIGRGFSNGGEVAGTLLRGPTLLISIAALFTIVGLALGNGAGATFALTFGMSVGVLTFAGLLRSVLLVRSHQRAMLPPSSPAPEPLPTGGEAR